MAPGSGLGRGVGVAVGRVRALPDPAGSGGSVRPDRVASAGGVAGAGAWEPDRVVSNERLVAMRIAVSLERASGGFAPEVESTEDEEDERSLTGISSHYNSDHYRVDRYGDIHPGDFEYARETRYANSTDVEG